MGAGPSRKQESAKSPPVLQLLKAQLKKSPAEEGAGISSGHIKGLVSDCSPYLRSLWGNTCKVLFVCSASGGASIRPKTHTQTCTGKTHVHRQKGVLIKRKGSSGGGGGLTRERAQGRGCSVVIGVRTP